MSTIDIAIKYFEHGQFRLSLGIVDEIFESYQIVPLLEIKIHSHLELDQMDAASACTEYDG